MIDWVVVFAVLVFVLQLQAFEVLQQHRDLHQANILSNIHREHLRVRLRSTLEFVSGRARAQRDGIACV